MQAKGKNPIMPVATRGVKRCLLFGVGSKGHLPVSFGQIWRGNESGFSQPVQEFIDSGA